MHEIVAGLLPPTLAQPAHSREIVTRAEPIRILVRRTPPPLRAHELRTPPPLKVAPPVREAEGLAGSPVRSRAARAVTAPRIAFARHWQSKPVWDVAASGAVPGARAGPDAGTGTNGDAVTGAGAGAAGSGAGATSGDPPCGVVTFSDPHGSQYDSATRGFRVDIRLSVHLADGTAQSLILDYPWYYPSEAANPWSDQNLKDPSFPTRFQPPPAAKLAAEPALVRYVVAHSTREGLTLLDECPQPSATTAP